MVFSSTVFLFLFLPFVLMVYFVICKEFRNAFLFLASSFFYWYGEQKMLLLMYFVILLNYGIALLIGYIDDKKILSNWTEDKTNIARKFLLLFCIVVCVGLLWYYKYWNFSIHLFNKFATLLGVSYKLSFVDKVIFPLGISFYIFQVFSYLFDIYLKKTKPEKNLLDFAVYIMMFPQLIAGPIIRYNDIKKQLKDRSVSAIGFANGARRFCFGLGKKILIANTMGKAVDKIFAVPTEQIDFLASWVGAICYSLQLYFDFSGYSDMAIGIGAMFGFYYKENFNYPYMCKTVGEYWRRWHISLSTWLRDYIYFPMGGSRKGRKRLYFNLIVVFLVSGLWHGAKTTFVLWGLWFGIFIVLEAIWIKDFLKGKNVLAHIYALCVVIFSRVLFRASGGEYAIEYWKAMLGLNGMDMTSTLGYLQNDILLAGVIGIIFSIDWREEYKNFVINHLGKDYHKGFLFYKLSSYVMAGALLFWSVCSIISSTYNPFIYFKF